MIYIDNDKIWSFRRGFGVKTMWWTTGYIYKEVLNRFIEISDDGKVKLYFFCLTGCSLLVARHRKVFSSTNGIWLYDNQMWNIKTSVSPLTLKCWTERSTRWWTRYAELSVLEDLPYLILVRWSNHCGWWVHRDPWKIVSGKNSSTCRVVGSYFEREQEHILVTSTKLFSCPQHHRIII